MADRIHAFLQVELVGGHLHIVLDDWNLENHNIEFCIKQAQEGVTYGHDHYPADPEQVKLGEDLLAMTLNQRGTALALAEQFFKVED